MRTIIFCQMAAMLIIAGCTNKIQDKTVDESVINTSSGETAPLINSSITDSSLAPVRQEPSPFQVPQSDGAKKQNQQNNNGKTTITKSSLINYFEQANKKFNEADYAGCIPLYDKELEVNSSNAEAFNRRNQAKEMLAKHNSHNEKPIEEKIAAEEKTHLESLMHDAEYKFKISDYIGAIKDYNSIIEQKLSANCEVYYKRGLAKAEFGKYEDAIIDFNKAIELFPAYSDAYFRRALCLVHLEKHKEAISDFSHVIKLHPKDKIGYFNRGLTKGLMEDFKGAVKDFSQSIELDSLYEDAYFHRAEALGSVGKVSEAVKDLTLVIGLNNHSKLAYYNRGQFYLEELLYAEAVADFLKVTELNPKDGEAFYFKGIAEMDMMDMNAACDSFKKAVELGYKQASSMVEKKCKKATK